MAWETILSPKEHWQGCHANPHWSSFRIMILVNSWPDGLEQLLPMPCKPLCWRRQNSSFVCDSLLKVHKGNFLSCELLLSEQHFPWKTIARCAIYKQTNTQNMHRHFFQEAYNSCPEGTSSFSDWDLKMFLSCHYIQADLEGYNWANPLWNSNALRLYSTLYFSKCFQTHYLKLILKTIQGGRESVCFYLWLYR